ncbi:hypothetical protein G6F57_022946 [Rhizopus arrhizus]|nr:hypothetical protein G6F57_022946 [Rhizopus arrhizus]
MRENLGSHAETRVAQLDFDARQSGRNRIACRECRDFPPHRNDQASTGRHGVARVDHNVQQGVLKLAGIGADVQGVFRELVLDPDRGAHRRCEDVTHAIDTAPDLEPGGRQRLPARVGKQLRR